MESVPPDARVRTFLADCPDFGRFWFARVASALAVQMQAVAVGWQVYALTGSAFALGMVGLAQFLPMALLTLPAGHAADRYDRRTICVIALTVQFAAGGVLAVGCWGHWIGVPGIFGAVALIAAARAFERPANQSLLPALVPRPLVPKAVAWRRAVFRAPRCCPALGGVLYGFGPAVPYATAAVLALAALALMATLRVTPGAVRREPATFRSIFAASISSAGSRLFSGAYPRPLCRSVRRSHGIAAGIRPRHPGRRRLGLGALRAAPAVGSVLMSAYLARRPLERQVGRKMFGAVLVFGMATILFGFSRSFVLSLAALTMLGAADIISVVVRSSLVQLADFPMPCAAASTR